MSKQTSRISTERQLSHLERKHAEFARRVAMLDEKFHLTATEKLELQQLKKLKLMAKDAILDCEQN